MADGGQACSAAGKLLMRCRDLVPTGGPVGKCLNAITSSCKQLPLKAGGTLPLVQATQCTAGTAGRWLGGWGHERAGGAGAAGCPSNPLLTAISTPVPLPLAAPLCSDNPQRTFCSYCRAGSAAPVLCVASGEACVDTYKARGMGQGLLEGHLRGMHYLCLPCAGAAWALTFFCCWCRARPPPSSSAQTWWRLGAPSMALAPRRSPLAPRATRSRLATCCATPRLPAPAPDLTRRDSRRALARRCARRGPFDQ